MIADINVFNPDIVAPGLPRLAEDLPAGARRVVHPASGFLSTIVAGQEIPRRGEHTGALPGALVRVG